MQPYNRLHQTFLVLSILSLLIITYATLLINNFKTPEATSNFFAESNTYFYVAEIIKTQIRNKYPRSLRTNVIQLAAVDSALNYIVSPSLVERLALPVLKLRQRVAGLPLSFADNSLVLDTTQYTEKISNTISSLGLPSVITDATQQVVSDVPNKVALIDTKDHPNSVLASITRTRIFFENLDKLLRLSWAVLVVGLVILLIINMRSLKRLTSALLWIAGITGGVLLLLSLIFPFVAGLSQNPDPVTGVLRDEMIDSLVSYYFSLTRGVSLVFLVITLCLFLIYRYAPFDTVQNWTNTHILPNHTSTPTSKSTRKKSTRS